MAWLTEAEEDALVDELELSTRVQVTTMGSSVEGRPMRLLRIGIPPPGVDDRAVLLIVGGQHGIEPSGREACYALAQQLVDTDDASIISFLEDHGVLLWPNANPDRITLTRLNAEGLDLNRQHVTLSSDAPETRALADVLQRTQPAMVVDLHEAFPQTENVTFVETEHPMADATMVGHAQDLIAAMKARATAETWTSGDYSTHDDERLLHNAAGVRNASGVLVEVSQDGTTDEHRIDVATAMAEEALDFAVANASTLITDADAAEAAAVAAGEAGTAPFDLRTATIDPPPLGYRLTVGDMAAFAIHLDRFGIARSGPGGLQLSMGQAAYRALPFLVDAEAEYASASGTRLFTLEADPAPPATVAEFAEVLSGSHEVVVEARVLTSFQSGSDPDGTEIPIIGGDVSFDATAEVWSSLELETVGIDEATGQSWFPRFPDSLLAPYGNEIFVRRGVDTGGGGILWSPLGVFRIESVEQQGPHSESAIRISGQDRMGGIVEAELTSPREYAATATFGAVFADLVGDVYPAAVIAFDDASAFEQIGRRLVVDESRYEPLLEMADSLGKALYFDGEGVLRVEDPPSDDEPVWRVAAGRGGVMLSSARRVTREGAFNAVIVLGEGGGGDDPVRGVAVDNGPQSPTRWGGRFGRVPRTETLPQVTTASQAAAAARQILRRNLGAPFSADFTAVPNPALRPRHPVMVVQRDGNRELHAIETLSIPLAADGDMPATTRERTHIVLGSTIS